MSDDLPLLLRVEKLTDSGRAVPSPLPRPGSRVDEQRAGGVRGRRASRRQPDLLHNKREHRCSGCHIEKARLAVAKHAGDLEMVTAEQRRRQDSIERYREEYANG